MITDELGKTELGRDMLAQDYILKQLAASLIYPEKEMGKAFWDRVYTKAREQFGTTDIPVDTFNKVWITADKAKVLERNNVAYVVGAHLKVMLESDYEAMSRQKDMAEPLAPAKDEAMSRQKDMAEPLVPAKDQAAQELSKQVLRDVVIPAIEKEVNEGQNFAMLRQMFYSMILASWYKLALKDALLNQVYSNQAKTSGVLSDDPAVKDKIHTQYLEAYKKGVFNYIKEDMDPVSRQPVPRKYFSGGARINVSEVLDRTQSLSVTDDIRTDGDLAMATVVVDKSQNNPQMKGKLSSLIDELHDKMPTHGIRGPVSPERFRNAFKDYTGGAGFIGHLFIADVDGVETVSVPVLRSDGSIFIVSLEERPGPNVFATVRDMQASYSGATVVFKEPFDMKGWQPVAERALGKHCYQPGWDYWFMNSHDVYVDVRQMALLWEQQHGPDPEIVVKTGINMMEASVVKVSSGRIRLEASVVDGRDGLLNVKVGDEIYQVPFLDIEAIQKILVHAMFNAGAASQLSHQSDTAFSGDKQLHSQIKTGDDQFKAVIIDPDAAHHLSVQELSLLREADEQDGFHSKRARDDQRIVRQIVQIEMALGASRSEAEARAGKIMADLHDKKLELEGEEVHILNNTGPGSRVIGRVQRNIAEKYGYVHETANVVLISPDGKIILQLRNTSTYDDHLAMYGGHLGVGESHVSGVLEEMKQETGLSFLEKRPVFVGYESYDLPGDNNRERRSWFVYVLTSQEYDMIKARKAANDAGLGISKAGLTRGEYKAALTKFRREKMDGSGEIVGIYEFSFDQLIHAATARNPDSLNNIFSEANKGILQSIQDVALLAASGKGSDVVMPPGGIDLNAQKMALDVVKDGKGVAIKFDPAMAAEFQRGDFTGLEGVIINIVPIASPLPILGLEASPAGTSLAKG